MITFNEKRRQQFITEQYFSAISSLTKNWIDEMRLNLARPELGDENLSLEASTLARQKYELLSLNHTAGEPIEPLRDELESVIEAHEKYAELKKIYEQDENEPPLYFAEIDEYERCLQLISLCYLLHRRDLLPRIAAMQDPIYSGTDTIYEDLLAFDMEDRFDVDQWYHDKPYRDLVNSLYRDESAESIEDLKKYCKNWFIGLKKAPWHNSHLRMTETDGDYFGYWAFEAGAVAYLLELDDSGIDHMVYPRDLVAWARANEHLSKSTPDKLRCEANHTCPKTGYWWTPAKENSRGHFKQGEIMPDFPSSSYGVTIWQWDQNQIGS